MSIVNTILVVPACLTVYLSHFISLSLGGSVGEAGVLREGVEVREE